MYIMSYLETKKIILEGGLQFFNTTRAYEGEGWQKNNIVKTLRNMFEMEWQAFSDLFNFD